MMKVMVTGGTGLVGKALEEAIANDPRPNEEWVFLSFKDGDLRSEKTKYWTVTLTVLCEWAGMLMLDY